MEDHADEPESPVEKIAEKIHGHDSSSSSSSSDSNSYVREVVAGLWVLSLIGKLFSVSNSVASVIYHSNLLSAFEAEINNTNDALVTLSVLELLYEVAPFAEKAVAVFKKHYAVFDAKVLSKIPRGPLKDKKKN